jgi:IS4 transposase
MLGRWYRLVILRFENRVSLLLPIFNLFNLVEYSVMTNYWLHLWALLASRDAHHGSNIKAR